MGTSAAETVKEIEEVRGRLQSNMQELEQRLPAPALWVKRLAGIAAGGGLAGSAFWFAMRRMRNKKKKKERAVQRVPVEAVVQVLPENVAKRIGEKLEDDTLKKVALAVGGAWLLFRLAEMRQMRKMNKALLAR